MIDLSYNDGSENLVFIQNRIARTEHSEETPWASRVPARDFGFFEVRSKVSFLIPMGADRQPHSESERGMLHMALGCPAETFVLKFIGAK